MDSLTARHLARELDARWREGRVSGGALDRDRRIVSLAVEGSAPVCFDLADLEVPVREAPPPPLRAGGVMQGWIVRGVCAPEDDRRLVIELARPGKFRGSAERRAWLEISALPTARGALLRDAGGTRLAAVGGRLPPPARPRPLAEPGEIERAVAAGALDAMLRFRWMSPAVAAWLAAEPSCAEERYRELAGDGPARPAWCGDRLLPFPMCDGARPAASLIAPAASAPPAESAPPGAPSASRNARAIERMRRELERARAAPRLRAVADALMALGDAPAPESVALPSGAREAVSPRPLPGESAVAAAERVYATVRSMERALERLPARITRLEQRGEEPDAAPAEAASGGRRGDGAGALPYRAFQSSGGLEILVGRGAKANDALTFHAASPEDVWLHARDAAGAHVVLRWSRAETPPARDLEEAALLAAWHSRSRGSTVVPVDWTRRKYVRKPRGGAPGLVLVQRAETVFVRPDPAAIRRLKERR
ncbi:MAG TPA: NFACT RNA binding domain-containing protein [Gemmatimonadaceae bacterium]